MNFGSYVGYCVIVREPKKTRNLWGDISEIAHQMLPVIERNDHGDCMCYLEGKGLVDVDSSDVKSYTPNVNADPLSNIINLFKQAG